MSHWDGTYICNEGDLFQGSISNFCHSPQGYVTRNESDIGEFKSLQVTKQAAHNTPYSITDLTMQSYVSNKVPMSPSHCGHDLGHVYELQAFLFSVIYVLGRQLCGEPEVTVISPPRRTVDHKLHLPLSHPKTGCCIRDPGIDSVCSTTHDYKSGVEFIVVEVFHFSRFLLKQSL